MKFKGTDNYISTRDLNLAVNASITLERPLLIKGEPGTGKTMLAFEVAEALEKDIITWHIKSSTTAQQGLYEYDAVSRLRDSQLGDERVSDISNYINKGKLWEAFESKKQVVLLIDEIDKADIEFPNDLLLELDMMEFYCYELKKTVKAKHRPIIIITSNNEKELPDAFLRRCFFHYISFPERETLKSIVKVHYPKLENKLIENAMNVFYDLREIDGLKKKPSTSELIDWIKLLIVGKVTESELGDVDLSEELPLLAGALLKNEQDHDLLTRIRLRFRR
jgi:MoxR-like ATPase